MLICLSFGYRCTSAPLAYSFAGPKKKTQSCKLSRDDHVACKIRLPANYEPFAFDRNGSEGSSHMACECASPQMGLRDFTEFLARKPSCGGGRPERDHMRKKLALPTKRQSQSSRAAPCCKSWNNNRSCSRYPNLSVVVSFAKPLNARTSQPRGHQLYKAMMLFPSPAAWVDSRHCKQLDIESNI